MATSDRIDLFTNASAAIDSGWFTAIAVAFILLAVVMVIVLAGTRLDVAPER